MSPLRDGRIFIAVGTIGACVGPVYPPLKMMG